MLRNFRGKTIRILHNELSHYRRRADGIRDYFSANPGVLACLSETPLCPGGALDIMFNARHEEPQAGEDDCTATIAGALTVGAMAEGAGNDGVDLLPGGLMNGLGLNLSNFDKALLTPGLTVDLLMQENVHLKRQNKEAENRMAEVQVGSSCMTCSVAPHRPDLPGNFGTLVAVWHRPAPV
ncbi:unnamed protein product [Protopolystoma xenopodis]|uniref:Uncharacterized protein n=1 Tax=Protopolystoma xenopodis TaxID=117903 RepID=A0A3S5CDD7_9PLAT|nr:unnamed protein product [Protopolystoma xenopodis]